MSSSQACLAPCSSHSYVSQDGACPYVDGVPVFYALFDVYVGASVVRGLLFALALVVTKVFVDFSLFNLITATIVDTTQRAARQNEQAMFLAQEEEAVRVVHMIKRLIHAVRNGAAPENLDLDKSSDIELEDAGIDEQVVEISRAVFDKALQASAVRGLFDSLEIAEDERNSLFNMIDSNQSGGISLEELVDGLMASRGHSQKSDTVTTKLAVMSIQRQLRDAYTHLLKVQKDGLSELQHASSKVDGRLMRLEDSMSQNQRGCSDRIVREWT